MNKLVISTIIGGSLLGILALSPMTSATSMARVSGQGQGYGRQTMLEARAKMFGMTSEELSEQLETKTMLEIAEEKGIEQTDLQAKMHELARARWAEKGLNESEIAEREAFQEQRQASCDGAGSNHAQGGFGRVNR